MTKRTGLESLSEASSKAHESEARKYRAEHRTRESIATDHELRHDLKLIHELLHDADADIAKAERFLKLTQNEYGRGVKNGPDMLGAFQRYYEFQQRRTNLYREFYEKRAELIALIH